MKYVNASLSTKVLTLADSVNLNRVLMFAIQNTGTTEVYVDLNEAANQNLTLTAGAGITFRATKETLYHNQQLNVDFGSSGTKSARIILETLGGKTEIDICNE